ncbi:MAG: rhodanese-like domain-containing protein [Pseudomonadales bacterium]|nr:rhodanese-like domain-containing protein [Pseudomonadales bacterium]
MEVKKGVNELVAEAEAQVITLTPAEVDEKSKAAGVTLVDLRDIRELKRDGTIPGSLHVPRGMLEFWIDPESPYYRREFDEIDEVILFCNKGSRSALAALSLKTMGMDNVSHMQGGMSQWEEEIGRVEPLPARK